MPDYQADIGMEVHAELLTQSKMFCGCRNAFGGEPNTRCCPVCLGLPGALPVMNRVAVERVIRASLALNCRINRDARFDRKNYFYPDLPKGYQISEYDRPIGASGWLDVESGGKTQRVHIRRVHLEEDTGKLQHATNDESEVDYNRSGVPLMEIVTEFPPDMHTPEVARDYLTTLRAILTYIGVSDGKMEEGSLRCEPNLSVRLSGAPELGTKTEIKNLNSFRSVYRGTAFEIERQIALRESGERVVQETRGWNESTGRTFSQRSKEVEQEYRYFPEPDLVPLNITDEWIDQVRRTMPELPTEVHSRFVREYGLPPRDADQLTQTRAVAVYFEEAVHLCADPKAVANWMTGDFARLLNASGTELEESKVTPKHLAGMIELIEQGTISGKMAKGLFERMFQSGEPPETLAQAEGPQISDADALQAIVAELVEGQRVAWDALVAGDDRKFGYFVGQVMNATQGKANPQEANRVLRKQLDYDRATER